MMKGTYRTALEWAKVLLSLDPQGDRFCMRLLIHNLGLRAQEHQWLCDLYSSGFHKKWRDTDSSTSNDICSHSTLSWALAALRLGDHAEAREILLKSISKLPWLFKCLYTELNLEVPPKIKECLPKSKADTLLTKLYISQTKDLWNTADAISLMDTIFTMVGDIEILGDYDFSDDLSLDVVRFIYLENTPELLALVPEEQLHRNNNSDSDPIPPEENIFSYEAQRIAIEGSRRFRPGFIVIGRWNPVQNSDGNQQIRPEGIEAEVRESGSQHGSIAISAARLLGIFWSSRSSEEETDDEETAIGSVISSIHDLTTGNDSSQPQIENGEGDGESVNDSDSLDMNDARPRD